jgi:glucose/arabinose dehydrogenase
LRRVLVIAALAALAACGERALLPPEAGVGPQPQLPAPVKTLLPTVKIAPAAGWPEGRTPSAAAGLQVQPFATGLQHPRWLLVLPDGDVLVAETNAPERPQEGQGLRGWVMGKVMARAGAAVPSPNRITLLRDADGDGRAEVRHVFAQGLNAPFGMALVGDRLYVANTDGVLEFAYRPGQTALESALRTLTELPAGPRNHHWTKALVASPDGSKLYATVGSNSNVAENGMAEEEGRAAIWEIDRASGRKRLFATGLRNPNGMAWVAPGTLWTVVNERDELGSDLVPDYLTSVRDGAFYGWPWSWYGRHVDDRVKPPRPEQVARAVVPDYALGTHVAPLGLAWTDGGTAPAAASGAGAAPAASAPAAAATASVSGGRAGMFVGLHGSWNRRPPAGYKVVFVPFAGGRPQGMPSDVLTGFLGPKGQAFGRPVGVALDARGALLVADDVGNTVWRVSAAPR